MKLLNATKIRDDCYSVVVQDDTKVVGQDEKGVDIYWTGSLTYNPANSMASLKTRIEDLIKERETLEKDESSIISDIKYTVEAIDVSKLEVK